MKIITVPEFLGETAGGWPPKMNVTPYVGHKFECACGQMHEFTHYTVVMRELSGMRLVLACPEQDAITCVKVKGIFRFKGFESLFGARVEG